MAIKRNGRIGRATLVICSLGLVSAIVYTFGATHRIRINHAPLSVSNSKPSVNEQGRIEKAFAALPLQFELNQGQADPAVKFIARSREYTLFLGPREAAIAVHQSKANTRNLTTDDAAGDSQQRQETTAGIVRLRFANGNAAPALSGEGKSAEHINYLHGNDPAKFQMNVPAFARVRYQAIYPGIDLVYYGNQQRLEYDFEVSAGADPSTIALNYDGVDQLEVNQEGDLLLHVAGETMTQHKPVIYQEVAGVRSMITGRYVQLAGNEIGFAVGNYDNTKTLVIDPVLSYAAHPLSGFINGAMTTDANGNVYYTGRNSGDFSPQYGQIIPTSDAFQSTNHSVLWHGFMQGEGIFVKLSLAATGELHADYATYFGGRNDEGGNAIKVDDQGNVYIAGETGSPDFPITSNARQTQLNLGITDNSDQGTCCQDIPQDDAFVMKFGPAGNLLYSSFLGGSRRDFITGLGLGSNGEILVAGGSRSVDMPVTPDAYSTSLTAPNDHEHGDVFIARLSASFNILYCTYLGGTRYEDASQMTSDAAGNIYVAGITESFDFPVTDNAFQRNWPTFEVGTLWAYLLKLDPSRAGHAGLRYSTYIGAGRTRGIATDNQGNIYVDLDVGCVPTATRPCILPVTAGAMQTSRPGGYDVFALKVNPSGTATTSLVYGTYLGGSDDDQTRGLIVDGAGNAYIGGNTYSRNLPVTTGAFQTSYGGGIKGGINPPIGGDAFLAKIDPAGSSLVYFTYLGGAQPDNLYAMARDRNGNIYLAGDTASADFPFTNNTTSGRSVNNFIVKIGPIGDTQALASANAINPLNDPANFVRQQYLDFLNREPDPNGLSYWTSQITQCGADAACIDDRKVAVSAAFFISDEFQLTGYFVYRFYKASYGRMPDYTEFTPDRRQIVGGANLDASKAAFSSAWITRDAFQEAYPATMSAADFVNRLYDTSGLVPYTAERQQQIALMGGGKTRDQVLREVIETPAFQAAEYNRAFVLTQYFGFLKRDGEAAGLAFWIDVLDNRDPNNFRGMVKAFISSAEYQDRFATVPVQ